MRALLFSLLLLSGAAFGATPETRLSGVFQAIEANRLDDALRRVDALILEHPNFRLAHLVRGDLLLARARPLETFGNVAKTVPAEKVDGLRHEALARLRALRHRPGDDRLPRYVLQLHPEQKHAFVVDSRSSRLYVFSNDNGMPKLVADYYVTLGKNGMEKTREGDQNGTAARAAAATASGCTACRVRSTRARRARATAASCCRIRTSNRSGAMCRSG
jgi:hypothetical protein